MKKKRILAVLPCLALIVGMAGCGSSSSDSESDSETLTIWCWDESFNIPIMETAAEYYRESGHSDFEVNIVNTAEEDVESKSITAFTSGVSEGLPDILLLGDYSAQTFLTNYEGEYADLTDAINADDFAESKVANYTIDGKLYGVPFDSGSAGMYYRIDLFEEAGYTADDLESITWGELVEIAKDVKEATGNYVFVFTPYKGYHYIEMALQSTGQWFYADEEENPNFVNNDVIRYMFDILKQMYENDLIYPVDYWSSEGIAAVQEGNIAAHLSAVWYVPTLTAVEEMSGLWGYTTLPQVEGVDGATQYSNIGGSSWVVLEKSENKDLAIDFLKTVYDGNLDFYDQILSEQGAVATYLPSTESEAYQEEVAYFNNQTIYADFAEWGSQIPAVDYGMYTNEACDALSSVLQDYLDGNISLDDALTQAEENYKMQVGL